MATTTMYKGYDTMSKDWVTNTNILYPHNQPAVFESSTAQPDDMLPVYHRLLSPDFTMAFNVPGESSQPAFPSTHEPRTETEHEVIRLSRRIMELLNARAYHDPFFSTHVSPSIYISLNGRIGNGIDDLINFHRDKADRNPHYHCSDETITVTANEAQGIATTITNHIARHLEGDDMRAQRRSGTILWSWRRVEGIWVVHSLSLIEPTTTIGAPEESPRIDPLPIQPTLDTDVEIIRLTRRILDLFSAREYYDPFLSDHVSPSVYTDINGERIGNDRSAFIHFYKREADINPRFFVDVQTITAMANDARGTATAVSTSISQTVDDERVHTTQKAATMLWSWKIVEGTWWLQSCILIWGTCEYLV